MKDILELARIVRLLLGNKGQEQCNCKKEKLSKEEAFYNLLIAKKISCDKAAAAYFYGQNASPSLPKYQQLKSRVKQKLIVGLLSEQTDRFTFTSLQSATINCWRVWAAVQILRNYHSYALAFELAEKVLKMAIKFEIVDLALASAKLLRLFCTHFGKPGKWVYYNDQVQKFTNAFLVEAKIDEYNQALRMEFKKSNKLESDIACLAWQYYDELKPYLKKYETNRIQRFGRFVKVMAELLEHDYKSALTTCDLAIDYFQSKLYNSSAIVISFYFQKMLCYINLKDYTNGIKVLQQGKQHVELGTFNWFKYQEMGLILALHSGQYQVAYQFFLKAALNENLKKLPDLEQESWKLYEAYIWTKPL